MELAYSSARRSQHASAFNLPGVANAVRVFKPDDFGRPLGEITRSQYLTECDRIATTPGPSAIWA